MSDDRGGWVSKMLMWEWHEHQLTGYPGWELEDGKPLYVDLTIVRGQDKDSYKIACEWDDFAKGAFYYRDWTESGLPFVSEGETYRSAFWFALHSDRDEFAKRYLQGISTR